MSIKMAGYKIEILREQLFRTAMSDGILSEEELSILFSINFNFPLLADAINRAIDDLIVDEGQMGEINQLTNQIKSATLSNTKFNDYLLTNTGRLLKIIQRVLINYHRPLPLL